MTKRVVGVAGDQVTRQEGGVAQAMTVPRGCVWVEGDNANNSIDSHTFGAVATELIDAKVVCKLWPLREVGLIPRLRAVI
tara:strand:- start:837 stop:1076 length:240 start_codon:yes stop_codon:yes gene_type:complete